MAKGKEFDIAIAEEALRQLEKELREGKKLSCYEIIGRYAVQVESEYYLSYKRIGHDYLMHNLSRLEALTAEASKIRDLGVLKNKSFASILADDVILTCKNVISSSWGRHRPYILQQLERMLGASDPFKSGQLGQGELWTIDDPKATYAPPEEGLFAGLTSGLSKLWESKTSEVDNQKAIVNNPPAPLWSASEASVRDNFNELASICSNRDKRLEAFAPDSTIVITEVDGDNNISKDVCSEREQIIRIARAAVGAYLDIAKAREQIPGNSWWSSFISSTKQEVAEVPTKVVVEEPSPLFPQHLSFSLQKELEARLACIGDPERLDQCDKLKVVFLSTMQEDHRLPSTQEFGEFKSMSIGEIADVNEFLQSHYSSPAVVEVIRKVIEDAMSVIMKTSPTQERPIQPGAYEQRLLQERQVTLFSTQSNFF